MKNYFSNRLFKYKFNHINLYNDRIKDFIIIWLSVSNKCLLFECCLGGCLSGGINYYQLLLKIENNSNYLNH